MKEAASSQYVAIDTETNGEDIRDGRGIAYGCSIAFGDTSFYLPFRHRVYSRQNYDLRAFVPYLQKILNNATVIYHNAKFDLVSLRTLGLDIWHGRFMDTMVLCHLIDENRPFQGKSLDACVAMYCDGLEGKKNDPGSMYAMMLKSRGYADMSAGVTAEYAAWDAWITFQLFLHIKGKLNELDLGAVWEHKQDLIRTLIAMEDNGIKIDVDLCELMSDRGRGIMEELRYELGINPASTNDLEELLINQLKLPVVKLTPKGKPCFDKYAMVEYEEMLERTNDRRAQQILAYRGWSKSCSSNYEPYVYRLSPDGRLRPNYRTDTTVTGRLSCVEPNLQQIPRAGVKPWNGIMKKAFVAKPGFTLLEGDYAQLEFRLSAAFAKQKNLLDTFNDETADVFDNVSAELDMERQDGKTLTYTLSYGGGPPRIANVFGVSIDEGRQIRDNFFRTYPNLQKAARYANNIALAKRRVPIWSGRFRNFLNPKVEAHKAYNSLVQGGAADIVERTMVRCLKSGLNNEDCRMLLQVHDSIVFEVRTELVPYYKIIIKECMQRVEPNWGVLFKVEVKEWGH